MDKKERIEQEIQKTLDQFDHTDQLSPNPFFFSRVQARLEEKREQSSVFSAILKPALLTALVVLNLSTAVWYFNRSEQQEQTDRRQQLIEVLASDFNLDNDQSNLLIIK